MKKQFRKIISVILVCYIVLLSLSVSSFAQITLINSNMTASTWSWASYGSSASLSYDSSLDRNKFEFTSSTPLSVRLTSLANSDVYLNHSYKMSFDVWGHFEDYNFSVVLVVKENVNTESSHILCTIDSNLAPSNNEYTTVNIDFSPSYFVGSVNSISLDFVFSRVNGATNTRNIYIKNLSLIDVDNDSGFWATLWQKLQELKNSLSSGFTNLTSNLLNKLQNVKEGIESAISNIQIWFNDVGDFLKDYLLYFQHPVELDENGVPVDENGNPIYENIFEVPNIFEWIDDKIETLDNAKSSVESATEDGVEILEQTIAPLNTIISGVSFFSIFISFALAIIVIKKVIE